MITNRDYLKNYTNLLISKREYLFLLTRRNKIRTYQEIFAFWNIFQNTQFCGDPHDNWQC